MAATINVPTGSKNLMDTQKKQILTDTSNVQTSSTVGETNAKCTCGLSKNGFSFILNSKSKLKRSMSEAQSSLPRCSCAVNGRRKSHRTYSSPSKTLEILSLPVATLNTPLTSPTLDPSSLNPGHSPINNAQFASENLSFEDVFLDTPPPTYASLIRFTLLDIPPDYEAVTGIPLARDLDLSKSKKSESRNSSQGTIPFTGRIIIIIVVVVIMIVTLVLILAGTMPSQGMKK